MKLGKRRPHSSAPSGNVAASTSEKAQAKRYTKQSALHHAPQQEPSSKAYGQRALSAAPRRDATGSDDVDNANVDEGANTRRRHRSVSRSPSEPQHTTLPSRSVATNVRDPGSASATRFRSGADAIAFQYYACQQRARRQLQQEHTSVHDTTSSTVLPQQRPSSGRGISKPTTPSSRGQRTPFMRSPQQHPQQLREVCGAKCSAQRERRATPPPLYTHKYTGAAIQDTSASLVPSTPPSRDDIGEGEADGSASAWQRSARLTSARQRQSHVQARVSTSTSSSGAQDALTAAACHYESNSLLQHYGGVYAAAAHLTGAAASSLTSLLPPTSRMQKEGLNERDGRALLVEALQTLLNTMRRAAFTAEPSGAAASKNQGRCWVQTPVGGVRSTLHKDTSVLRGSENDSVSAIDGARRPRETSAGGRAPRQLRSRVVASREDTAHRSRSRTSGRNKSPATATPRLPHPVPDFMATIKPPHRHGLGGALPPTFAPSSPLSLHNLHEVTSENFSGDPETKQSGKSRELDASPNLPARGRVLSSTFWPGDAVESQLAPSSHPVSREVPVRRVLPLSGGLDAAPPFTGAGALGSELSPGAAAARRVYWEQQQQQQQQSEGNQLHFFSNSQTLLDEAAVAVPRYLESMSTENIVRPASFKARHEYESFSLDDSVLRSDVHSFPSAPAGPHEILAASLAPTTTSVPGSHNANTANTLPLNNCSAFPAENQPLRAAEQHAVSSLQTEAQVTGPSFAAPAPAEEELPDTSERTELLKVPVANFMEPNALIHSATPLNRADTAHFQTPSYGPTTEPEALSKSRHSALDVAGSMSTSDDHVSPSSLELEEELSAASYIPSVAEGDAEQTE